MECAAHVKTEANKFDVMNFEYYIIERGQVKLIIFSGRLFDVSEADDLYRDIDRLLERGLQKFIIDFSRVDYINSAGLNVLITLLSKIRESYGELYICAVSEKVLKLIETSKLTNVFKIEADIQSALSKLNN